MTPSVEATQPAIETAEALESLSQRALVHAFEYRGRRQVVDPVTGVVFEVGEREHLIALALAADLRGADLAAVVEYVGVDATRRFMNDIVRLERTEGMFRRSRLSLDGEIDKAVGAYLAAHPRKMMLCVSQTCNLRCVYCYAIEGNYHDEGRMMSLETAQQAMRFLAGRAGARRGLTVTLFGGEPLINFGMIKYLVPWAKDWARSIRKRAHFCITTNGTLLSDEVIEFLIQHEFSILISLDGPKEVQNASRPSASGRGSFDAAAPKIQRLLSRHPHPEIIKVRATMTHQSHDTRALARFFEEFGFQRIGLGANFGYAFYKGPHDLTVGDRKEMYEATEALIDEGGLDTVTLGTSRPYDPLKAGLVSLHDSRDRAGPLMKMPCGVGRNDQGIDVDGKVYPCHRYVGLKAYELGDIWKGVTAETLRAFYSRVLNAYKECGRCWATRWCSGHCPNYLSDPTGHVFGPDDPACDSLRANVERSLALYEKLTEGGVNWDRLSQEMEV